MKISMRNALAVLLLLTVIAAFFVGCGAPADAQPPQETAAPAADVLPGVVTVHADGKEYTFESVGGQDLQQLLEQANISLGQGDVLSMDLDQSPTDRLVFRVLRKHTVTVVVTDETTGQAVRYPVALMEGTVADALAALGIEPTQSQTMNLSLITPLETGMEIILTGEGTQIVAQTTQTTDPVTSTQTDPVQDPKTIVSIEVYEDCDGSGHGIKVITYADGTQEEVQF